MATITGTAADDSLVGTAADDVICGLAGNDTLHGGAGRDTLNGGAGDDALYGGGHRDHFDGGAGFDLFFVSDPVAVNANLATGLVTYIGQSWPAETMVSIEGLVGGAFADVLTGNAGDNHLEGRAGDDTLVGGGGDDTLLGGQGGDSLSGGAGDDSLVGAESWDPGPSGDTLDGGGGFDVTSYAPFTDDLDIDLAAGTARRAGADADAAYDRLTGIEGVTGGSGDDLVTGSGGANYLAGGAGDDTLIGGGGRDTLAGGDGNDLLWGGGGNDVLDGGAGFDIAVYRENTGPVRIDLGIRTASFPGTGWQSEYLAAIEGAETGSGDDTLVGDWADNAFTAGAGRDRLLGGAGNDTLDGGAGVDTIDGGADFDTASFASIAAATTVNLATGRSWATANPGPKDILRSIEAAIGGSGDDRLIGTAEANRLDGGAGDDTIEAGAGWDTLVGGLGDDNLRGGAGWDEFVVDPADGRSHVVGDALVDDGTDVFDGGAGFDTLIVRRAGFVDPSLPDWYGGFSYYVSAAINLSTGLFKLSHAATTDLLFAIENVTTADGDDTIVGSAAANRIDAGDGANRVWAGAGDDTILGGSATWKDEGISSATGDMLDGGAGNDAIYGNGAHDQFYYGIGWGVSPGTDTLVGGSGDDSLYSSSANVEMSGGTGADDFYLTDEPVYYDYRGDGIALYPAMTITDFSTDEGDRIFFALVESGADVAFVGEAAGADLALHEAGYAREGDDTVVRIRMDQTDNPPGEFAVITLDDYAGPLTADDLLFI